MEHCLANEGEGFQCELLLTSKDARLTKFKNKDGSKSSVAVSSSCGRFCFATLQPDVQQSLHEEHPEIAKMNAVDRCHVWWASFDEGITTTVLEQSRESASSAAITNDAVAVPRESLASPSHRLCGSPKEPVFTHRG